MTNCLFKGYNFKWSKNNLYQRSSYDHIRSNSLGEGLAISSAGAGSYCQPCECMGELPAGGIRKNAQGQGAHPQRGSKTGNNQLFTDSSCICPGSCTRRVYS